MAPTGNSSPKVMIESTYLSTMRKSKMLMAHMELLLRRIICTVLSVNATNLMLKQATGCRKSGRIGLMAA